VTPTLESLRREHDEVGIGPHLDDLLRRIVRATAQVYPPTEYSPAKVWNQEALDDVLQDWVSERLFGRRDLDTMLSTAASLPAFRRALSTSVSQMIINHREKTSAANLFKRSRRILQSDTRFISITPGASPANELWTLAEAAATETSEQPIGELTAIAWEVDDDVLEVVRYGPTSLKSSPILREEALLHFLAHLLARADGALTLGQLLDVMRRRFNLLVPIDAELNDKLANSNLTPLQSVEIEDLATSVLARMGNERARVLRGFTTFGGDVGETAHLLDVSVRQVIATVREVMISIAEYAESYDEAKAVYDRLTELLDESRF
jgi:hypothetical protein